MITERMLLNRFIIIILLLSCCFTVGCPPPRASLLLKDEDTPVQFRSFVHEDMYYNVKEVYSIEQLKDRLSSAEISRVRLVMSDDEKIFGDAIEIRDGTAFVCSDDHIKHEVQMVQINRLILYKEIPAAKRRESFLTPFLLCTAAGALSAYDSKDPSDVLVGALIGVGLGIPMSINKHKETEMILNLLNETTIEPKRY